MEAQELEHYQKLFALEHAMEVRGNVMDLKKHTRHHFANGSYVREFFLPKGFVVTGKIHRYACINILVTGKIAVAQADGIDTVMSAPFIYTSGAGEKKVLFALEDTLFINVHRLPEELIDCTDPEELEDHFIVPSFEALEQERHEALEVTS